MVDSPCSQAEPLSSIPHCWHCGHWQHHQVNSEMEPAAGKEQDRNLGFTRSEIYSLILFIQPLVHEERKQENYWRAHTYLQIGSHKRKNTQQDQDWKDCTQILCENTRRSGVGSEPYWTSGTPLVMPLKLPLSCKGWVTVRQWLPGWWQPPR